MTKKIKVSVLLTSYNHAKYLKKAIDSVLDQTFSDFELIIWDDASTDESWQIITSYSDIRIKSFRNEARKRGIWGMNKAISEIALGEYIAIHHSDDIWELQKLEKQVAFLDENPAIGAVFSNALIIGENDEPFKDVSHFYYEIFDQPNRTRYEWLNHFFYHGNVLCHPSLLIRKACYDDCGLYRYAFAQIPDFDMWVRLCLKYDIHVLPEKLIQFRVRLNEMNTSGDRPETNIRAQFELLQMLKNYRRIETSDDFLKIFPDSKEYLKQEGFDMGFALGMAALEPKTLHIVKLFGLELLFEALNDPERARSINNLYKFSYQDFIALTAKHDVFLVELRATLTTQLREKEQTVQELTQTVLGLRMQLSEIFNSRTWKFLLFLRKLRGSRREKL